MSEPEFWASVTTDNATDKRTIRFYQRLAHHTPAGVSRVVHTTNVGDHATDEDITDCIDLTLAQLAEKGVRTVRYYELSGGEVVESTPNGNLRVVPDE